LLIKKIIYNEDSSKVRITFWDLPEIKIPPEKPKKGPSGGIISRFDERTSWLPRVDSNHGPIGYDLTPVT
ncbi:MAG: hypothetical protein P9X22_00130, partial [Candidatus Zapsychrus exili]|nr:hypothetical protein [Candidatus Zapsychrus exili]